MDPYEADPTKIPSTDLYVEEPGYGRYQPLPSDFRPDVKYTSSTHPASVEYWTSVLQLCTPAERIYEDQDGGRDVFALGSVIVKSTHLKASLEGRRAERDYSFADANEISAVALAKEALRGTGIEVPQIFFAGKINERYVLVQSRIPGVGLCVAWQYLSQEQKDSFKWQARALICRLASVPSPSLTPSYLVPDDDPVHHRGVQELEKELLFAPASAKEDLHFVHNDTTLSNIIVNDDRIVGLIDWEMAGFFGWNRAAAVHVQVRSPKKEYFRNANLSEEQLRDTLFWNDLYDKNGWSSSEDALFRDALFRDAANKLSTASLRLSTPVTMVPTRT